MSTTNAPAVATAITLTLTITYERGIAPSDNQVLCAVLRGLVEDDITPTEVLITSHEITVTST